MIFEFKGFIPIIDPSSFVHPQASIIGNVIIGKDVYVGPGAVLRGDWGAIEISDGCNVQENCVIHMFPGVTVKLHRDAHIGHSAIIHGATIGENTLIGMNSVIMDNVVIGKNCIVGALSFVNADTIIPDGKMVVGNPAKVIQDVTSKMISWKSKGTRLYQTLPKDCKEHLKECEALTEMPAERPTQESLFQTWNEIKDK